MTFSAETDSRLTVTVYDILGREVIVLADGVYSPGIYSVTWDGRNSSGATMPSGTYYLRLTAVPSSAGPGSDATVGEIRKMLLLK